MVKPAVVMAFRESLMKRDEPTARREAHKWFDRIWESGIYSRSKAYRWLAYKMGKTSTEAHFISMNCAECLKAIEYVKVFLEKGSDPDFEENDAYVDSCDLDIDCDYDEDPGSVFNKDD